MSTAAGDDPEGALALDRRVRGLVYDAFLTRGNAISKAGIAAELSIAESLISESFNRLADAHVLVLQPASGEVLMANPFSAVPTAFRVRAASRAWWGNCIWDALGIIAMTGRDGTVETSCRTAAKPSHSALSMAAWFRPKGLPTLPSRRPAGGMISSLPEEPCSSSGRKSTLPGGGNCGINRGAAPSAQTKPGRWQAPGTARIEERPPGGGRRRKRLSRSSRG